MLLCVCQEPTGTLWVSSELRLHRSWRSVSVSCGVSHCGAAQALSDSQAGVQRSVISRNSCFYCRYCQARLPWVLLLP